MKTYETIEELIGELRSKDGSHRMRARESVVMIGKRAVPYLTELLSDKSEHVRWEACKALRSIRDPQAAPALVAVLDDDSMAVQWLAAEALIALKDAAIIPLLELLEIKFDSVFVRQGAHHILHAFEREEMLNAETIAVIDSLRSIGESVSVAFAAQKALLSFGSR